MTKILMTILCSLSSLCHAADFELCKRVENLNVEDTITLTSENQEFVIPKEIATTYSQTIKSKVELANQFNQPIETISLGEPVTPETLQVIISLMTEAHNILIDKPKSAKGSYVQLSQISALNRLNAEQLLQAMHAGLFLQLDERILKAIALKIAYLIKTDRSSLLLNVARMIVDMIKQGWSSNNTVDVPYELRDIEGVLQTQSYNLQEEIFPYLASQYYLLQDPIQISSALPREWEKYLNDRNYYFSGISVRDLLVHEKVPKFLPWPPDSKILDLSRKYLANLDGLDDIQDIKQTEILRLQNNFLQEIPSSIFHGFTRLRCLDLNNNQIAILKDDLFKELGQLTCLYLERNQLRSLPKNIFNNLANLHILDLQHNPLDNATKQWIREKYPFATLDEETDGVES